VCIYCGLVNRTEHIAHGTDLNCVIGTRQGGGLYLYSSHIPYKVFKHIKSCGGREEGREERKGKRPIQNPNFPCSPTLVWRASFFSPQYDGVSPLTQFIRNASHTAYTEMAHCLHVRKILAITVSSRTRTAGKNINSCIFKQMQSSFHMQYINPLCL